MINTCKECGFFMRLDRHGKVICNLAQSPVKIRDKEKCKYLKDLERRKAMKEKLK